VPMSPNMPTSRWGRLVTRAYLVACALALVAMLVETVSGHAGIATMFAAILAAPWSMLVAGLAPPLPRDWPMAAGLAVRMIPLALFMLLNAAIVRGIAARAERDLARTVTKTILLALVALVPSGCRLMSRQEVFVGAPTQAYQLFNGGHERTECFFDLTTSPQWIEQHGQIARITGLTIMGDFKNLTGSLVDVKVAVAPRFDGPLSSSEVSNLHLAAVFELK